MEPSVGRIVHYQDANGKVSSAIVTRANGGDVVNLTVFPDGIMPHCVAGVKLLAEGEVKIIEGWRWPPRV